jgi:hypothetical protein
VVARAVAPRAAGGLIIATSRTSSGWVGVECGDDYHVVPLDDLVGHEQDGCVCGPTLEAVPRDDGSMGWMYTHHSLDRRERYE